MLPVISVMDAHASLVISEVVPSLGITCRAVQQRASGIKTIKQTEDPIKM